MDNVLEKELTLCLSQLDKAEKKSLLKILRGFLNKKKTGHPRISIAKYNQELEEAMEQVRTGDVYKHSELVKMTKNW